MPSKESRVSSASVVGPPSLPWHWNRPPQSPVWQWPTPLELNEQPVRPQIRPPQPFGTVNVTLWPGASFQPVTGIGCWALGLVAAQIVSVSALTIVITCELAEWAMVVVVAADVAGAGVAVVDAVRVGEGVGDAVVRLGLGAAVVAAIADAVVAAWLDAVDPSAALRVPSGPTVVSQA